MRALRITAVVLGGVLVTGLSAGAATASSASRAPTAGHTTTASSGESVDPLATWVPYDRYRYGTASACAAHRSDVVSSRHIPAASLKCLGFRSGSSTWWRLYVNDDSPSGARNRH